MPQLPSFLTASQGTDGGWHPTVIYLLILIVAEMFVFGVISKVLR